jgi:hypothetical protein
MTRDEITRRVRRGLAITRAEHPNNPSCAEVAYLAGLGARTVARPGPGTTLGSLIAMAEGMNVKLWDILREFDERPTSEAVPR